MIITFYKDTCQTFFSSPWYFEASENLDILCVVWRQWQLAAILGKRLGLLEQANQLPCTNTPPTRRQIILFIANLYQGRKILNKKSEYPS